MTSIAKKWMLASAVLLLFLVFLPDSGLACTVCMGGQEESSRKAFIGTTAFLTFLPLAVVGIMAWFFFHKTFERERLEEERRVDAFKAELSGRSRDPRECGRTEAWEGPSAISR
jgi:uncharacterized membrane protein